MKMFKITVPTKADYLCLVFYVVLMKLIQCFFMKLFNITVPINTDYLYFWSDIFCSVPLPMKWILVLSGIFQTFQCFQFENYNLRVVHVNLPKWSLWNLSNASVFQNIVEDMIYGLFMWIYQNESEVIFQTF